MTPNKKALVLVLGAGASKEVNLPIGSELTAGIENVLRIRDDALGRSQLIDPTMQRALDMLARNHRLGGDVHPFMAAARRIGAAMAQATSIDNFIDSHRDDKHIELVGKLAIVHCILAAERESLLAVNDGNVRNNISFKKTSTTWYHRFFQMLVEACPHDQVRDRLTKLTIISFNYDRCLEHYLHGALQNYYGFSYEAAATVVGGLEIHHPYGTVGPLPWANAAGAGTEFGAEPNATELIALAKGIKTFTEGTDPKRSDIVATRAALASTDRIAFLGFAFHRLNMELLMPRAAPQPKLPVRAIYGSTLGISGSDTEMILIDLANRAGVSRAVLNTGGGTCAKLLEEYSKSLSL